MVNNDEEIDGQLQIKQVNNAINKVNVELAETIGKENKQLYKELQELTNKIEEKTIEILSLCLEDEEIQTLLNGSEIVIQVIANDYKKQKAFLTTWEKTLKKVNNSFVADNFFLLLNSLREVLTDEKEEIQKDLQRADDLMFEKDLYIKDYDQLQDTIIKNNRKIFNIQKEIFKTLKTETTEIDGEKVKTSIMTDKALNDFSLIANNTIDEKDIYKLDDRTRLQLKVNTEMKRENEKAIFYITIKRNINYLSEFMSLEIKEKNIFEEIANFQPKPIVTYNTFNDKVSNILPLMKNNETNIIKGTSGNEYKDLEIKALISNAEIKQNKVLSTWDKYILQAIYSVTKENIYFDVNMIKRALAIENRNKINIDKEIKKSIEKMSITKISLDIAKELNNTYKTPLNVEQLKALGVESYLLPIRKVFKKVGGVKQEMYNFLEKPIYFAYLEARNQILSLATDKLLIASISDTKENTMLKIYLKSRIDNMKYQKKNNKTNYYIDTILYDTIFKENELLQDEELKQNKKAYNKKRDTYRQTIRTILQHYKDIKDIKNFEEIKTQREYTKIKIEI